MTDLHLRLAHLYAGRRDVWGAVHGEQIKRPLTDEDWYEHVHGEGSVGVYPLVQFAERDSQHPQHWGPGQWYVKWCGVDIDEGDEEIAIAINVWRALKTLGIFSWVERSKGKGWHVLAFLETWMPAQTARNAMLFACEVADYKPKEVYPKQIELPRGSSGNYLNAAYAKRWADAGRRVMMVQTVPHPRIPTATRGVNPNAYLSLEAFLTTAENNLASISALAKAAALYKPPPPPRAIVIPRGVAPRQLRGFVKDYFETGPHEGQDRSTALQHFAHMLQRDGFSAGEALSLVAEFDQRLGKFVGRPDAEKNYERIVSNAYG